MAMTAERGIGAGRRRRGTVGAVPNSLRFIDTDISIRIPYAIT